MTLSEDNLMISDKVWILVGMLLRNGYSCTPSQLSDRCHMLKFSSSEIEWLCKLPFSPLCLSHCGRVTFSQFVFHFFDDVREKYAIPSKAFVSWNCPSLDSLTTPSKIVPFSLLQSLCLHAPPLSASSLGKPSSNISVMHILRVVDEGAPSANDVVTRQRVRKRHRQITFVPSKKRQYIKCSQSLDATEVNRSLNGSLPISASGLEGKASCTSSLTTDVSRFSEVPKKLEAIQLAMTFADCASCYSQQSCTAAVTCLADSVAELNETMPIEFVNDSHNSSCEITKGKAMQLCNADNQHGCLDIPVDLSMLADMSQHRGLMASALDAVSAANKNMPEAGTGLKTEGSVSARENQAKNDGNIPSSVLNCSEKPPKDHAEVVYTPSGDIVRKDAITGPDYEATYGQEVVKNDLNSVELLASRISQLKGKAVKESQHRKANGKSGIKLCKMKKSPGTRKQVVVEGHSSQPAEDKFPSFKGFIVEAIEGSGGYGTVYKAVSKDGGKPFAIKYPFERTSSKHVQNEIKVLQKFGGQSFIPKCLDVIEESGRQCLVLEYIEHEKPEVLKKEISISQLQSYGFSLFKALEYLHSKGVIHRDVKPGNFLFSRNKNCGWLVDFNLATVALKQSNFGLKSWSPVVERVSDRAEFDNKGSQGPEANRFRPVKGLVRGHASAYSSKGRTKVLEIGHQEKLLTPSSTPTCDPKLINQGTNSTASRPWKDVKSTPQHDRYMLRKPESCLDVSVHSSANSPVTRASPATEKLSAFTETATAPRVSRPRLSTYKSPLREQFRILENIDTQSGEQMVPRYGRRELWELVHKSKQSPQPPVASLPSNHKKRVAAPQKRKHSKIFIDQSLPQSSSLAVSKFSIAKTPVGHLPKPRGVQKLRREGPCAGTKGYRAPEVLLKSAVQTEKIDVWSAGVSLFQLLLGKSPFSSSSNLEQSLLDIAQYCGSDAICTLAKELNREASLPKELNSLKVQPVPLSLWCEKNIKRPDIIPSVPLCLLDLLEKCLEIDPQKRISAKEALQHEFFESCRKLVPPLFSCKSNGNAMF